MKRGNISVKVQNFQIFFTFSIYLNFVHSGSRNSIPIYKLLSCIISYIMAMIEYFLGLKHC
jgi:hypothetical protein